MANLEMAAAETEDIDKAFLLAIGAQLKHAREERGLTWADVERKGGPTSPTLRDHENGQMKTLNALTRHCLTLGQSLVDIVMLVIDRESGKPTIDPTLAALVRRYERLSTADKALVRTLADRLPEVAAPAGRTGSAGAGHHKGAAKRGARPVAKSALRK